MERFYHLLILLVLIHACNAQNNDDDSNSKTDGDSSAEDDNTQNKLPNTTEAADPGTSTVLPVPPRAETVSTLPVDSPAQELEPNLPKGPEDSLYIVSSNENKICLAIKFDSMFSFNNSMVHLNKEPNGFSFPKSEPPIYEGRCNPYPSITITEEQYKDQYNLTMGFNKTKDKSSWRMIYMKFKYDPKDNKSETAPFTLHAKEEDLKKFSAPISQSLNCEQTIIPLYNKENKVEANIVTRTFKIQAYNLSSEFGNESPCSTPPKEVPKIKYQSDVAPIAVGSTLAILTLGLIAGYAIYRSLTTKKVDYATME